MENRNYKYFAARLCALALALAAIHALAQEDSPLPPWKRFVRTYEPYTFSTLAGNAGFGRTDGTGSSARFYGPRAVAVDSAGNIYVADFGNNSIRKVTPAGVVTTLADNSGSAASTGGAAYFNGPSAVAVDSTGNVYVTSYNTIRKGYPPPRILNSGFNRGEFGFALSGPVGHVVVVEVSTDFLGWDPIWTNTFAGPLNFSELQSGSSSHRFYRAQLVP
jgi:hypothetical protein